MTEERLQGAIDLANDLYGCFQLEQRDSWNYVLVADWWNVIADWNLEQIYDVLVSELKNLLKD